MASGRRFLQIHELFADHALIAGAILQRLFELRAPKVVFLDGGRCLRARVRRRENDRGCDKKCAHDQNVALASVDRRHRAVDLVGLRALVQFRVCFRALFTNDVRNFVARCFDAVHENRGHVGHAELFRERFVRAHFRVPRFVGEAFAKRSNVDARARRPIFVETLLKIVFGREGKTVKDPEGVVPTERADALCRLRRVARGWNGSGKFLKTMRSSFGPSFSLNSSSVITISAHGAHSKSEKRTTVTGADRAPQTGSSTLIGTATSSSDGA